MITDYILTAFGNAIKFLINLIPNVTFPSWFQTGFDFFDNAVKQVSYFHDYLPLTAVSSVFLVYNAIVLTTVSVRIIRIIISLVTGGGGNIS
jgi:hypothetical protein